MICSFSKKLDCLWPAYSSGYTPEKATLFFPGYSHQLHSPITAAKCWHKKGQSNTRIIMKNTIVLYHSPYMDTPSRCGECITVCYLVHQLAIHRQQPVVEEDKCGASGTEGIGWRTAGTRTGGTWKSLMEDQAENHRLHLQQSEVLTTQAIRNSMMLNHSMSQ